MNKKLKKQIICQSNLINSLFVRVSKIEEKVIRKNYTVRATCSNCFREQELSVVIGEKRPTKYSCEHCRCEVEPKVFSSW